MEQVIGLHTAVAYTLQFSFFVKGNIIGIGEQPAGLVLIKTSKEEALSSVSVEFIGWAETEGEIQIVSCVYKSKAQGMPVGKYTVSLRAPRSTKTRANKEGNKILKILLSSLSALESIQFKSAEMCGNNFTHFWECDLQFQFDSRLCSRVGLIWPFSFWWEQFKNQTDFCLISRDVEKSLQQLLLTLIYRICWW